MAKQRFHAAILLIGAGVAALTWGARGIYESETTSANPLGVVAFDTARYVNARRAIASDWLNHSGHDVHLTEEAVTTLARIDSTARPTIEQHADGRVVIVAQALVLDGQVPDITDDVLAALGLPLAAPTIDTHIDAAGDTGYSTSSLYELADDLVRGRNDHARRQLQATQETDLDALLP